MFLCEILTEQQQAPPKTTAPPAQNVHVHVHQPPAPKEKAAPKPKVEAQPEQVPQEVVPVQADEQDPNSYDGSEEYDPELDGQEEIQVDPNQEILPLKRYYLIGRLKELKSLLDERDIQNDDFDIVIKFMNNLSYNSLVSLANNIIPVVEDQLARLTTNA